MRFRLYCEHIGSKFYVKEFKSIQVNWEDTWHKAVILTENRQEAKLFTEGDLYIHITANLYKKEPIEKRYRVTDGHGNTFTVDGPVVVDEWDD